MDPILEAAREHAPTVIESACEALGVECRHREIEEFRGGSPCRRAASGSRHLKGRPELHDGGQQIVLFGAGGHAKIVLASFEAEGKYTVAGLLDDDTAKHGTSFYGYPVLGGREQLPRLHSEGIRKAFVSIGADRARGEVAQMLLAHDFELVRVVHPTATILRGARIGAGTAILINAFVGADASIGENVVVSVGAVVSHDCVVGSCVQLCPLASLAGNSRAGDYCFIGTKGSVLPGLTLGSEVRVGANAVVIDDLPDAVTAVGVPARVVRRRMG